MCPEDELWLIPKQRLAIKPPFELRSHFKMDFKSGLSMIVRRVIIVSLLTIESLSNNEGDGYENVTEKVNFLCLKPYLAYSMSNDGNCFWSWLKDCMKVQGEKEVQQSLMHAQSCYFANLNTLLFLLFSLPSPYTSNISLQRLSAGSKL